MQRKKIIGISLSVLVLLLAVSGYVMYILFAPSAKNAEHHYVYLDRDDTADSLYSKLDRAGRAKALPGIRLIKWVKDADSVPTGKYQLNQEDNAWKIYARIFRGHQTPVRLSVSNARSLEQLAAKMDKQLMLDSLEIMQVFNDSVVYSGMGYEKETRLCMVVPNTYEVYWNISAEALLKRLVKEHDIFWNDTRLKKAEAIGLTPKEVCALASIVDEESNMSNEKPIIAGLYMNRLRIGMPLQADPTVKFAMGDAAIRRITRPMLQVESPYNTYIHIGLPPGPIRIASIQGIDGVLNYARHDYLYMCAKEDFSGYHNFAVSHGQHMRNAQRYWNALNRRKIFK